MPSVQIDPDKFLEIISSALKAAIIVPPKEEKWLDDIPTPPKAKRGRPAKALKNSLEEQKKIPTNDEIDELNIESAEEILAYKPPPEAIDPGRRPKNTAAAKRTDWKPPTNMDGSTAITTVSVVDPKRKQRFVDDKSVGKDPPGAYANLTNDRRPPAKMMTFTCDRCRCSFECYPSEIPQAFIREKDPQTGAESRPMLKCPECAGKPL